MKIDKTNNPLYIMHPKTFFYQGQKVGKYLGRYCIFSHVNYCFRAAIRRYFFMRPEGSSIRFLCHYWLPTFTPLSSGYGEVLRRYDPNEAVSFVCSWMNDNRIEFYDSFVDDLIDETFNEDCCITDGTELAMFFCAMSAYLMNCSDSDLVSPAIIECKRLFDKYDQELSFNLPF